MSPLRNNPLYTRVVRRDLLVKDQEVFYWNSDISRRGTTGGIIKGIIHSVPLGDGGVYGYWEVTGGSNIFKNHYLFCSADLYVRNVTDYKADQEGDEDDLL